MSVESGEWNLATKTKQGSSFAASQRPFSTQRRTCWNCDKPGHIYPDCRSPYNADRVDDNHKKFRDSIAKQISNKDTDASTDRRNRGTGNFAPPYKYCLPEPQEHNKRVIDTVPHTYDPSARRWFKDQAPDSGLDNSVVDDRSAQNTTQPSGFTVKTDKTEASSDTTSVMTEATSPQEFARMQLKLANLQQDFNRVTISWKESLSLYESVEFVVLRLLY